MFKLIVNGKETAFDGPGDTPLLWVLRDHLKLTGTKFGCGMGACGACTVLVDGKAVRSCQYEIKSLGEAEVLTIEGLPEDHPLKLAWNEESVPQCGYCQPGQILGALDLLKENPHPTPTEIAEGLSGHLCRCGTYPAIIRAVDKAADEMAKRAEVKA